MTFKEHGYQIVRNFLDADFVKFIQQYFILRIRAGHSELGDIQAPNSFIFYGDPLIETILDNSCKSLSKFAGINLLPTYSYTRLYGCGDELKIHRDRPSCEISATLALGFPEGDKINSIYFSENEDGSNSTEIILNPGDLCIYRGCNLYHWRPKFTQKWYLQAFLHYVDENGEYKENIYDGRPCLGMSKQNINNFK
jgi:hypothetical protein